jgi:hypothetical protein
MWGFTQGAAILFMGKARSCLPMHKKENHRPLNVDTSRRPPPPIPLTVGAKPPHHGAVNYQGKVPVAEDGGGSGRAAAQGRREQGPVAGEVNRPHHHHTRTSPSASGGAPSPR